MSLRLNTDYSNKAIQVGKFVKSLRSWLKFLILSAVLSMTLITGCRHAGNWLVTEDIIDRADAMVLLMGTFPPRVLQAVDLYHEGRAGKLIIVKEYMGGYTMLRDRGVEVIGTTDQARNALETLGISPDSITILPGDARSTLDEAMATMDFLSAHPELESVIIVSAPSHMRRARLIFSKAVRYSGLDVTVFCSPSRYTGFNADKWWKNKEDIQIVLSEYLKLTSFMLFEKRSLKEHLHTN